MKEKPWLKFYDEGVPASIDYPRIPLDQLLRDSANKHPEHAAPIFGGALGSRVLDASLSYRQLDQAVDRFAATLQRMGVGQGDRVTVMLPNSPQSALRGARDRASANRLWQRNDGGYEQPV